MIGKVVKYGAVAGLAIYGYLKIKEIAGEKIGLVTAGLGLNSFSSSSQGTSTTNPLVQKGIDYGKVYGPEAQAKNPFGTDMSKQPVVVQKINAAFDKFFGGNSSTTSSTTSRDEWGR